MLQPCPMLLPVRTGAPAFASTLSDVASSSDRSTSFCFNPVRSYFEFGQEYQFLLQPCPMLLPVRTRVPVFASTLSDIASGSDRSTNIRFDAVRCCFGFGQEHQPLLQPCPKLLPVRTRVPVFASTLSDIASGSDRSTNIRFDAVRCCFGFGQEHQPLLQPCPKLLRVRTRVPVFASTLSDVASSSDRNTSFCFVAVRSCFQFGQEHQFLLQSCPKLLPVRTGAPAFASTLSDVASSSDKSTSFCFNSV
ncbi:hypothetical protein [Neobacillus cucumis]|uniref:hypothetical protein n=1 Tax=Neobacillus cucumis TaxID=1740721 RepID=UPI003671D20C